MLGGEKYVSSSFVLPLLLLLFTKHIAVHDNEQGYKARFKAATLDDFEVCTTGMNGVK